MSDYYMVETKVLAPIKWISETVTIRAFSNEVHFSYGPYHISVVNQYDIDYPPKTREEILAEYHTDWETLGELLAKA